MKLMSGDVSLTFNKGVSEDSRLFGGDFQPCEVQAHAAVQWSV